MKHLIYLIIFILLLTSVYAECPETNVFKRLISNCKTPDNGICEDNEYVLKDKDCSILTDGKFRSFIFDMWFLKLLLFIGIIMYFKKNPNYSLVLFIALLILVMSGQFGVFKTPTVPDVKINMSEMPWFGEMGSFDQFYVIAYIVIVVLILWRVLRRRK